MLFLSRCCQAGGHSHGLSHGMVSWPLAWFLVSEGCMSAAVHDVLLSDTLIEIFGSSFAAIVTIEGSPEHVPFSFRVFSALESTVYRALVHLHHELLLLFQYLHYGQIRISSGYIMRPATCQSKLTVVGH